MPLRSHHHLHRSQPRFCSCTVVDSLTNQQNHASEFSLQIFASLSFYKTIKHLQRGVPSLTEEFLAVEPSTTSSPFHARRREMEAMEGQGVVFYHSTCT